MDKRDILEQTRRHLYPGRVERLLEGGIDFVPGRREGYRYWDVDGRELLDLHLNGGTFSLGHRNPELTRVLVEGLEAWDVGNHHFGSEPKAALARALVAAAPGDMAYVVLTAGGSEAVEVAIKSARHATGRKRNIRGAFRCRHGAGKVLDGAHVALIDDVMTTGATLTECAKTLRRAGVAGITVWVAARAPAP